MVRAVRHAGQPRAQAPVAGKGQNFVGGRIMQPTGTVPWIEIRYLIGTALLYLCTVHSTCVCVLIYRAYRTCTYTYTYRYRIHVLVLHVRVHVPDIRALYALS